MKLHELKPGQRFLLKGSEYRVMSANRHLEKLIDCGEVVVVKGDKTIETLDGETEVHALSDSPMATVTGGQHEGQTIVVHSGYVACELPCEGDKPGAIVAIEAKHLRYWESVKEVTIS